MLDQGRQRIGALLYLQHADIRNPHSQVSLQSWLACISCMNRMEPNARCAIGNH